MRSAKGFIVSLLFLSILGFSGTALPDGGGGDQNKKPTVHYTVIVEPGDVSLEVGGIQQFTAYMEDRGGVRKDTVFTWRLTGRPIGTLSEEGLFTAISSGRTTVVATAGRFSGRARVTVERDSINGRRGYHVVVVPHDTILILGDSTQFNAFLLDSTETVIDTVFHWVLSNPGIGTLDDTGKFVSSDLGHTRVIASVGDIAGWGHAVVVRDSTVLHQRLHGYRIVVEPRSVVLAVGDSMQFEASLVDTNGNVLDAEFTWSTDGDAFGVIDGDGLFYAQADGQGFVYATAENLTGKAKVMVRSRVTPPGRTRAGYKLFIDPPDTMLLVGESLTFTAYLLDSTGNRTDTTVTWSLQGNPVGTLSETGEFTATDPGIGIIKAQIPRFTAVARVLVVTEAGLTECDSAQVRFRDREGNQVGHIRRIAEKDVLKISGLPFPLNILNGGQVLLPPGSLDQGISLEITLPDVAEIRDSTVTFEEGIIAGFSFDVYENGVLVHPYVFDPPVQIVLPYKPELMEELGLEVEDLAVFFYNPDGTYDPAGILNIVLDTTENRIYAEVSHFSQIVAGDKNLYATTGNASRVAGVIPVQSLLYPNYPNPFNPETAFRFDVGGKAQDVVIEVYNTVGQRVAVLLEKKLEPGQYSAKWDGTNQAGQAVGSGVYLIRMKTSSVSLTRRMVLMR